MKPPKDVNSRIERGRARRNDLACERKECFEFWRGNQYVFRSAKSTYLQNLGVLPGSGKPDHRFRLTFNLIRPAVSGIVSQVTQRVPSYEINPTTTDSEDVAAARLAGRVALYGYDKWRLRRVTEETVTNALVGDGGYAWPYFDTTVGPSIGQDEDGQERCVGEVAVRTFGPNEVFWEPGVKFHESRWHAVEQAMTPEQVYALPGFFGDRLKPDAKNKNDNRPSKAELILVTEYLERPSVKFPAGRWLTIADEKQIVPERPYPCVDPSGAVVDEPVLHKLSYVVDPDNDIDMGLVKGMLDLQRVYNDASNKTLEWKDHALVPQVFAPKGSIDVQLTDEPGKVIYYNPVNGQKPEWRNTPPVPRELFEIADRSKNDLQMMAGVNDIPPQIEAGKAIQAYIERMQSVQQAFIANLAEFHSRLMRHCLYLVQRHYTEPRLLQIRGRSGWEQIQDFMGASLRGQADVTVLAGSLEPRTREGIERRVMGFADRGWISPEQAMGAINGGTAEGLIEGYELDIARANMIIQKVRAGYDTVMAMTDNPDGSPGWMPRPFDNVAVQKSVWEDWMKTPDFDALTPELKELANTIYQGFEEIEAQKRAQEAEAQAMQAEQLGMQNAARPQGAKPLPDQPGSPSNAPQDFS